MNYTIFQNDKAQLTAHTLEEAKMIAKSLIVKAKNKNKGSILRPSQYVQLFKFIKEYRK